MSRCYYHFFREAGKPTPLLTRAQTPHGPSLRRDVTGVFFLHVRPTCGIAAFSAAKSAISSTLSSSPKAVKEATKTQHPGCGDGVVSTSGLHPRLAPRHCTPTLARWTSSTVVAQHATVRIGKHDVSAMLDMATQEELRRNCTPASRHSHGEIF